MILFCLPFPPPLHSLTVNAPRRGRVPSQRYLTWKRAAGNDVLAQIKGQSPIKGPVKIMISFGKPDNRKRDLTNLTKAPEDLMVSHGLIDDDSYVEDMRICWADIQGCEIRVWPASDVSFRVVELGRTAA